VRKRLLFQLRCHRRSRYASEHKTPARPVGSRSVHSNLVGSVPGKAQTNNSGSDKRELYTIAQALQKPYHDLLFTVHRIIIKFNGWQGVTVDVPLFS